MTIYSLSRHAGLRPKRPHKLTAGKLLNISYRLAHSHLSYSLLQPGGYFDSQTGDTQYFEIIPETPQSGRTSFSDKERTSADVQVKKTGSSPSHATPTPVRGSGESLLRSPSSNTTARVKRKFAELYDDDRVLEKKIEDAMIELGRLRTLADAKTVEINVLISQRYSRLKVSFVFLIELTFNAHNFTYSLPLKVRASRED